MFVADIDRCKNGLLLEVAGDHSPWVSAGTPGAKSFAPAETLS